MEHINNVFKAAVKRLLAEQDEHFNRINIIQEAQEHGRTMQQQRLHRLQDVGAQSLGAITAAKCTAAFHHTMRHFPAIQNREHITGDHAVVDLAV